MLLVLIWVESDTVGVFFYVEGLDDLTRFGIPIMHQFVVGSTQEMQTVVGKIQVANGFFVTHVGAYAFTVGVHIPKLYLKVFKFYHKRNFIDLSPLYPNYHSKENDQILGRI